MIKTALRHLPKKLKGTKYNAYFHLNTVGVSGLNLGQRITTPVLRKTGLNSKTNIEKCERQSGTAGH